MKKTLLIIVGILSTVTIMAQLPQEVTVGMPRVLAKKIISERDVQSINSANNWGQKDKLSRFWVVWSDRADNITYNNPTVSSGQKDVLIFNERVCIAEIQNNFAHVYTEAQKHTAYPQIMQGTDRGWVPMTHLLLWSSCPTNERGILNKALIVVNLSDKISDKTNLFKVYLNPNKKSDRGYATSSVNVRFVMKEDKETGLVLLANAASLLGKTDKSLYGWFNKDSYVKWSQRVCVEPNWESGIVEYFKSNGENIKVYAKPDLSGSEIIKPLKFGSIENKDGRDVDRYRMPRGSLRFPILDSNGLQEDNVYYINVFATNGKMAGAEEDNSYTRDSLEASFNEAFIAARSGKEFVNYMKETNSIMSAPGYTPKRNKDGHEYWKTVLFISADELHELLYRLEGVYKVAKNSDYTNREPIVNAFKGVIKAMIPEITNERMEAMSQEEIMADIAGLKARTEITQKYTLQQLLNSKLVDDQEYASIIQNFAEKYENLLRINTSKYPFCLLLNGNTYYWLPTDMIP